MIELCIHDYCQNCPNFKAYVSSTSFYSEEGKLIPTHEVWCENKDLCKCIYSYLKENEFEKMRKGGEANKS